MALENDLEALKELERDYEQASRNLDGNLISQIESGRRLPPQFENDERAKRSYEFWHRYQRLLEKIKTESRNKAFAA